MKELVVLSGKGGTGKTSIVASFAALANNKIMVDCDVDAADLHLVLKPQVKESHEFFGGKSAFIDKLLCTSCGKCREVCRFNAITSDFTVNKFFCEGCAACFHFCPSSAISLKENLSGHWFISDTEYGPLVHARLGIAEENSGKLVSLIRGKARGLAEKNNSQVIIIDGSPGIGCPVIASITGSNLVLVVVEPTLSSMHDLKRVVQLTGHFNITTAVCVNKADLNDMISKEIEDYCRQEDIKFLGILPYDSSVIKAQVMGKPVIELENTEIAPKIKKLWEDTLNLINL